MKRSTWPAPAVEASAAAATMTAIADIHVLPISLLLRCVADSRPRDAVEHLVDFLVLLRVVGRKRFHVAPGDGLALDLVPHLPVAPAAARPPERDQRSVGLECS